MSPSQFFLCGLVWNYHSRLNSAEKQRRWRRREERQYEEESRQVELKPSSQRAWPGCPPDPPALSPVRCEASSGPGSVLRTKGNGQVLPNAEDASPQQPWDGASPVQFPSALPAELAWSVVLQSSSSESAGAEVRQTSGLPVRRRYRRPGTAGRRRGDGSFPSQDSSLLIFPLPRKASLRLRPPRSCAAGIGTGRSGGRRRGRWLLAALGGTRRFPCRPVPAEPALGAPRSGLPHGRGASALSLGCASRPLPVSARPGHVRCPRSTCASLPAALAAVPRAFWSFSSASSFAAGRPGPGKRRALLKAAEERCRSRAAEPDGGEARSRTEGRPQSRSCPAPLPACLHGCGALPGLCGLLLLSSNTSFQTQLNLARRGWQHYWSSGAAKRARRPGFCLPVSNKWE